MLSRNHLLKCLSKIYILLVFQSSIYSAFFAVCATQEANIEELTSEVSRELLLGHPNMWDKYNLCQMTSGGKLNTTKLSVAKLRDICAGLDIPVDVSIKRRQPYADKIEEYCEKCRCKTDK